RGDEGGDTVNAISATPETREAESIWDSCSTKSPCASGAKESNADRAFVRLSRPALFDMTFIADVPVALLAGGLATRLRPITQTIPKALVELAGRPFIDHQLALLHRNGVRTVVMCLGYLGEQVRDHCGDGSRYGLRLRYSFDGDKLMGTGG